jgi:hypothetical protein
MLDWKGFSATPFYVIAANPFLFNVVTRTSFVASFLQPLAPLPLDSSPLHQAAPSNLPLTACPRPPELAPLRTHLEDGNCNVCGNVGQHQTFDAAFTGKPKLYIRSTYYKEIEDIGKSYTC